MRVHSQNLCMDNHLNNLTRNKFHSISVSYLFINDCRGPQVTYLTWTKAVVILEISNTLVFALRIIAAVNNTVSKHFAVFCYA